MEIQYFTECIIYTLISRYMAVICIRITCIADVMLGNCKKCILQCKKEAEEKKKKKMHFQKNGLDSANSEVSSPFTSYNIESFSKFFFQVYLFHFKFY